MTINLNNPLVIGTIAPIKGRNKHSFTRWAETRSKDFFIRFAQYLIDSCPDVSGFVIVDVETQNVIRFDGLVFDVLGMKSKRYSR